MIRLIHTILSNLEDRVKVRRLLQQGCMPDPLLQLCRSCVNKCTGWLYSTT